MLLAVFIAPLVGPVHCADALAATNNIETAKKKRVRILMFHPFERAVRDREN